MDNKDNNKDGLNKKSVRSIEDTLLEGTKKSEVKTLDLNLVKPTSNQLKNETKPVESIIEVKAPSDIASSSYSKIEDKQTSNSSVAYDLPEEINKTLTKSDSLNPPKPPKHFKEAVQKDDSVPTSFYSKRKPKKEKWYKKKWGKIGIASFTVATLGLSIGLGVYYGIYAGSSSNSDINFGDGTIGADEIKEWLQNQQQKAIGKKVASLESSAVVWAFDKMAPLIPNASKTKANAEEKVDDTIQKEKDQYKSDFGSAWETEWNKYLKTNGYDSEEEYKNSKLATELEDDVVKLFTEDIVEDVNADAVGLNTATGVFTEGDASDNKYHSMWTDNDVDAQAYFDWDGSSTPTWGTTGSYYAIKNGKLNDGVDPWTDEITGNEEANVEKYMTLYFNMVKPIAYIDTLFAFTFTNSTDDSGLTPGNITFDLATLKTNYTIAKNMAFATSAGGFAGQGAADATFAEDWNYLDFNDFTSTWTAPTSISSLAASQQAITNSILFSLTVGTAYLDTLANTAPNGQVAHQQIAIAPYSPGTTIESSFDFWYTLNDIIGVTVAEGNSELSPNLWWPGYEGAGIAPANELAALDSLYQTNTEVFDNLVLDKYTSDIGQSLNARWQIIFGGYSYDAANLATWESREYVTTIETRTTYQNNQMTGSTTNDQLLLSIANDGMHLTKIPFVTSAELATGFNTFGANDTVYYYVPEAGNIAPGITDWTAKTYQSSSTNDLAVIGERMLIHDLNAKVSEGFAYDFAPFMHASASTDLIITGFSTWFTTNFRKLALNEALNDAEFCAQYGLAMYDEIAGTWNTTDTEMIQTTQSVINYFYNNIYQTQLSLYLSSYSSVQSEIISNDKIYMQITDADWDAISSSFYNVMVFFNHDWTTPDLDGDGKNGDYVLKTIDELSSEGGEV